LSQPISALPVGGILLAAHPRQHDTLLWSSVAGRPLLGWALRALRGLAPGAPLVLVVTPPRLADALRLSDAEGAAEVRALPLAPDVPLAVALDTARAALKPAPEVIVVHEAVRPLVPAGHGAALIMAAGAGLAVSAEPIKDTIKRVAAGQVIETLPRSEMAQLVAPLAVRSDTLTALLSAFMIATAASLTRLTDLVAPALAQGIAVRAVPLAGLSHAVFTPEDLAVARALLPGGLA
jgi:2-C-methyl-D-erythritol 4-phosphate cytidylyltransferase